MTEHKVARVASWSWAALAGTGLIVGLVLSRHAPSTRPVPPPIVIVHESAPIAPRRGSPSPVQPAASGVPPEVVTAHLRRAYPLLADVALQCSGEQCALTATISPVTAQADLDRRQEMLLGGLAVALAADDYRLDVPFQMDEVADNNFRLRASVARQSENR